MTLARTVKAQKQSLASADREHLQLLARAYAEQNNEPDALIYKLASEIADARAAGRQFNLYKSCTYQQLLITITRTGAATSERLAGLIVARQQTMITRGIEDALSNLHALSKKASLYPISPVKLTERVGKASDGSSIRSLLREANLAGVAALTRSIVQGAVKGQNVDALARTMKAGLATTLNRALTIARNEEIKLYRDAQQAQYEQAGATTFRRKANLSSTTCPVCIALDGEEVSEARPMRLHVNCRCTLVPVIGGKSPRWKVGRDWFAAQPEGVQRSILGRGMFEVWKAGRVELAELVQTHHSDSWGESVAVKPLRDIK